MLWQVKVELIFTLSLLLGCLIIKTTKVIYKSVCKIKVTNRQLHVEVEEMNSSIK